MKTRILSSEINSTTYEDTYQSIINFLSNSNNSGYITVNNVHTIVEGTLDQCYGNIINKGFMALPDGRPLSIIARLRGDKKMKRVFGPTLLEKILRWGQEDELRHYFLGSTNETLKKLAKVIKVLYPKAIVCGYFSPPFSKLTKEENNSIIDQIKESDVDIIWVGLGAPKQEKWIYDHYSTLNHGIMIGIGAGFDYLAGNISHAPEWMKNNSFEWLYRLIQEPKRLWKRYLVTIPIFIFFNILDLLKIKKFNYD